MAPRRGELFVGTSGWAYDWKDFYPRNLPARRRLNYYAAKFRTVEVNYTFYHLPRTTTYEGWAREAPAAFLFTLKLSRFITHIQRLAGAEEALRTFLERAVPLGAKRGALLAQLPPSFALDGRRLERFLQTAHDVRGELGLAPLRLAFEFRHPSWYRGDAAPALELLRRHGAAFVCGHSGRYPYPEAEPLTTDFMYLRFHGPEEMFASLYGRKGLRRWVPLVRRWLDDGIDVFAYFNNDVAGYAVKDAQTLRALVEG